MTKSKAIVLAVVLVLVSFASSASAHLHPGLGRFVQRDPLGYADGHSLLEYQRSNANNFLDPSGTIVACGCHPPRGIIFGPCGLLNWGETFTTNVLNGECVGTCPEFANCRARFSFRCSVVYYVIMPTPLPPILVFDWVPDGQQIFQQCPQKNGGGLAQYPVVPPAL